ncbi:MAG: PEP-CTERM sorting domain-containing protein [Planctomycetota bacterium]|nr:MAG: PEP-CTERM sorting domain-containing protein [Planctomycetota bacterium]
MLKAKVFSIFCFLLLLISTTFGSPIILNEYNAVGPTKYLGAAGSDDYWGRVAGNGGDWFELVVIQDHLNMRRWKFTMSHYDASLKKYVYETLNLTNHSIWSDLRSGTIITISEDLPDNVSYNPIYDPHNPSAGDWWINVRANDFPDGTGTYIDRQSFTVDSEDWVLRIKKADGTVVFGPVGESVNLTGPLIGDNEIFRLEEDPSASITPFSNYDDAQELSTFGTPNRWGSNVQDFSQLRSVVPEPATVLLLGLGSLVMLRKRKR